MADFALTTFTEIANENPVLNSRIPEATMTDITTIKAVLNTVPEAYNAYVEAMVQRIGRVFMDVSEFENPLRRLIAGDNPMAHLVQELHFNPIEAEGNFTPAGSNPLGRRDHENVSVAYHQMNYQPYYAISVDRVGMMNALSSWEDLNRFWAAKMQSMYLGAGIDEYVAMRKVINDAIADTTEGSVLPSAYVGEITARDSDSGKALVQAIKVLVESLKFPHTYNQAGVLNVNRPEDFVLLVNKDVAPNLDVYTLASLFNPGLVEIPQDKRNVFTIDTFASVGSEATNDAAAVEADNQDVLGVLTTRRWFKFFETMRTVRPIENPQGLFTNFFLHRWLTLSLSPFETCVVLRSGDGTDGDAGGGGGGGG